MHTLPDHGLDLGALVLQREIAVPGGVRPAEARNFAAYPDMAIGVLHRPLQRGGEFRDGEFGRVDQVFRWRHRQSIRSLWAFAQGRDFCPSSPTEGLDYPYTL